MERWVEENQEKEEEEAGGRGQGYKKKQDLNIMNEG